MSYKIGTQDPVWNPGRQENISSLRYEDDTTLKAMATHSSILAWKIPWREEEPGRLQSMGSRRVGHD